jgi:tetratricopeptide (TPR) repeat protein
LTTTIERGRDRAEVDRRLLEHLEFARYRADEGDLAIADDQFAAEFRDARLDLAAMDVNAIGPAVASRPGLVKDTIVAALDCWAIVGRQRQDLGHQGATPWLLPLAAARAADPDPWRNSLRHALETKDRDAIARLARDDAIESRPGPSRWLLGRLLIWTGQIQAADDYLIRAWRIDPRDFWINLDLALTLTLDPWDPDLALVYANSAVALRPESAVAHLSQGWIQQCFANKVGAEAEYRAALRLWPDYGRAHARLAGLLFFRSRRAEAAEEYRAAIRLLPAEETEQLWVGLGDSVMRRHRLGEAEAELEEAARRFPRSARVWVQNARLWLAQRDVAKASAALDRAAALVAPGTREAQLVADERPRLGLLRRLPAL